MTHFDHESIQRQLPLAAAGALGENELTAVLEHATGCESCGRQLDVWGSYAKGLRQLPQPAFPSTLFARTHRRVLLERATSLNRRRNALMLGALVAFSWMTSFAVWIAVRMLTGGTLEVSGTNLVDPAPWVLFTSVLTWVTGGAAALTLSSHRHTRRFQ